MPGGAGFPLGAGVDGRALCGTLVVVAGGALVPEDDGGSDDALVAGVDGADASPETGPPQEDISATSAPAAAMVARYAMPRLSTAFTLPHTRPD
jgi:hypothetical protein